MKPIISPDLRVGRSSLDAQIVLDRLSLAARHETYSNVNDIADVIAI